MWELFQQAALVTVLCNLATVALVLLGLAWVAATYWAVES